MTKRVFIAATDQHSGKTTTSLLLMFLAAKRFKRVGFMKPVGQEYRQIKDIKVDKDAKLIAEVFGLQEHLPYMSPIVAHRTFTRDYLDGRMKPEDLIHHIRTCLEKLEKEFDFLVIEGTGHSGVGSVFGLSNAKVACLVDAPVVIVAGGGIGRVVDSVSLNLALYRQEGARVGAIWSNKLLPEKRDTALHYLSKAFEKDNLPVIGGLEYTPVLANAPLHAIARLFKAGLSGNEEAKDRLVGEVQIGAASSQRVVDLLVDDTLLVIASTRDELMVTLSSLYHLPRYHKKIAGMVIAGVVEVSPITQQILESSGIPYIRTQHNSSHVFTKLMDFIAKIDEGDRQKIQWIRSVSERPECAEKADALFKVLF